MRTFNEIERSITLGAENLYDLNQIAKELKCNRRFDRKVREFVPVFTTEGIQDHYGVTYYTWMSQVTYRNILEVTQEHESREDKSTDPWGILTSFLINEAELVCEEAGDLPEEPEEEMPKKPAEDYAIKAAPSTVGATAKDVETKVQQSGDILGAMNFSLPIGDMMRAAATTLLPELTRDVNKRIEEAAKELMPNIITIGEAKKVEIKGTLHKVFKPALTKLAVNKLLMIAGPTGSGKTYLSEQLAEALNLDFAHLSCTAGMSEAHITGRMTADGTYVSTEFVNAYENGGVFLFDEVDAADPNVLLIINSAIANGRMSVPNRKEKPFAEKHNNFYLVVAANTWGHGSFEYSGREVLDKAFLDRFNLSKVSVDYDRDLELKLTKDSKVTKALQAMRSAEIERSISTRTIITAYRMSEIITPEEVFDELTIDWTEEEVKKTADLYKKALV